MRCFWSAARQACGCIPTTSRPTGNTGFCGRALRAGSGKREACAHRTKASVVPRAATGLPGAAFAAHPNARYRHGAHPRDTRTVAGLHRVSAACSARHDARPDQPPWIPRISSAPASEFESRARTTWRALHGDLRDRAIFPACPGHAGVGECGPPPARAGPPFPRDADGRSSQGRTAGSRSRSWRDAATRR